MMFSTFFMHDYNSNIQPSDKLGKYVTYTWDKYVLQNTLCVYDSSGELGFNGQMLDYKEMNKGLEGSLCKLIFFF